MIHNYRFRNVNDALPQLATELLANGDEFSSRAGVTKELMHVGISLKRPWQREIVLPVRKANVAAQIVETMWVLAGRNDVKTLLPYLPRASEFSDDGKTWRAGYGPRLRSFHGVDQLAYLVDTMKRSPGSRQAVASIWDPTEDTEPGKDIACNNWLNFSSRLGYLDLHVAVRSNDLIWGWSGINAFEWSALLEIVAGLSGLMVGGLHFSTTSLHLYDHHWDKAWKLSEMHDDLFWEDSPRFDASVCPSISRFDSLVAEWFNLEQQIRTGQAVGDNVTLFPEPMMRSWLRVLQWYWSGDRSFLEPLRATRLAQAALVGVKPAGAPQELSPEQDMLKIAVGGGPFVPIKITLLDMSAFKTPFFEYVNELHAEKHAAYGDSWKRRGEPGILGNIGRKADRLGSGQETSDETQLDTAIDLLVYLAKYRSWLVGGEGGPKDVEAILGEYEKGYDGEYVPDLEHLDRWLDILIRSEIDSSQKITLVDALLTDAYALARGRY